MGSTFVVNVALSGSLSLLWGLINFLQYVTFFPLMNLSFPINAKTYYQVLFSIGTFDMIPTESIEESLDELIGDADLSEDVFDPSEKLSESTIEAGYDSSNVILNSTMSLLIILLVFVIALLVIITRLACSRFDCVKKCLDYIWRTLFWNFIIRTVLETFLEVTLVLMIKMYAINADSWFEAAGSIFAITILALLTLFYVLLPLFLHCKKKVLKRRVFRSKYGTLIQDLKTNEKAAHFYLTMFMFRRQMLAIVIVFLAKYPWAQIIVTSLMCSV